MSNKMKEFIEFLAMKVGGETHGDTLIRLAKEIDEGGVLDEDWALYLEELGERMNEVVADGKDNESGE